MVIFPVILEAGKLHHHLRIWILQIILQGLGFTDIRNYSLQKVMSFINNGPVILFPGFLAIEVVHPTPYYDNSYAVNSASQGPYGDAITYELIPHIEKTFRGIGQGWARFLYGGSTGGWEALAVQTFYPSEYNGCFAACPDPIDFRSFYCH